MVEIDVNCSIWFLVIYILGLCNKLYIRNNGILIILVRRFDKVRLYNNKFVKFFNFCFFVIKIMMKLLVKRINIFRVIGGMLIGSFKL